MHVSAGEDPSVVINADNFLCRLRSNINLCKEYRECKKTREYAYFRLAGKYMKVGDFCKLYQSLCSSSKPGDMVSIITIRSKDVKKSHEPKKYMENFTKAIQEYVNQNEGHVSVGSLGLTVGYFELKSLGDYDLVNENFSQICNIRRRCEELVIENAFALCFDAFKDTIFERAASSLGSCNVQEATLLKDPIEYTRFEYCLDVDQEILGYVKESTEKDSFFDKLAWRQNGADSVFGRIYSSMCRHEEKIRCLYFTNNEGELLNFLVYLVKDEYRELFKKISDDIAAIQIPIFEMKKSKERCKLFFADIYSQYIETVRVSKIFTGVRGEYNQLLCFCASKLIVAKFQIFFHSICHDEISDLLYDTYKAKTEKILQEIQSEQITTIVYNRQIDSESMYQLCDIIGNRKALDGSYKQQYIYLEDGRAVTQEEAKECCDACDKSALEPGDKEQLVEFYPIKKGVYEDDVESRNYICLRHHAVADYTRGLSYTASPTKPKETVITIDAFDKTGLVVASKEKIKSLIDACLARDHCKLVNAHVVNVLNGIGTILIHIVQYEKNDTALKKVLLIYDMPISNDVKNSTNLKYSNRRIIPRENVPDSSLHDLYHYLQFLQMITHSEFRILSSRYLKYMSFGKISDQNGDAAIYDLYSKVDCDAYNNCRSLENKLFPEWIRMQRILPFHISIWNITEFDHFLCTCGMDIAKFKWILCKLINNVCIKVDKLKQNFIVTGISPNRIKLILTLLRDNSVNLHICETVERCPTQSIVLNPLNILAKTKDFTRDSLTFGILDRIMRFINCETSLRAHIVTYMCEHYKHPKKRYAKGEKPNSAKKDCFRFILQQIDGIFTKAQNMIDGCCDMKDFVAEDCYLPDLQKAIDAKEIMQLVERIEREISVLRRRKKMKVTAVQIRKMTGGRLFAFYRYEETKVVEETSE